MQVWNTLFSSNTVKEHWAKDSFSSAHEGASYGFNSKS